MNRKIDVFCRQRKPVTLTVGKPVKVLQARFRSCSAGQGSITLELIDPPPGLSIKSGSDCTAVFVDGIRTSLFVSSVIEHEPSIRPFQELRLVLPETLERTELRNTFRIPVQQPPELDVNISCRGKSWNPRALDISIGGLLVEFTDSDQFDCSEYDDLDIVLKYQGKVARMEAIAQPRWSNFWAVYFSEVLRGLRHGEANVPDDLRAILDCMERDWVDRSRLFPESPELD